MHKVIVSVLGPDRPGIIATVSKILFELGSNIENVSQTILQEEFSGIFIATLAPAVTIDQIEKHLTDSLKPMGLRVFVKHLERKATDFQMPPSESFIITTMGPDRKGLVAGITAILARYGVNVTNLQAVFKGGEKPDDNVMIYEVDIPNDIDHQRFRGDLRQKAQELDLDLTLQHKRIFEEINRL